MRATRADVLRDNIRYGFVTKGWSVAAGSRACGLHERSLYRFLNGRGLRPQLDTLRKVADALGVSVRQLLGEAPRLPKDRRRHRNAGPPDTIAVDQPGAIAEDAA